MHKHGSNKADLNQVCYVDSYPACVLQDRTCIDQAHEDMEIPESVCSDVIDSFSNTEEEFSDCEMVIKCLFT